MLIDANRLYQAETLAGTTVSKWHRCLPTRNRETLLHGCFTHVSGVIRLMKWAFPLAVYLLVVAMLLALWRVG